MNSENKLIQELKDAIGDLSENKYSEIIQIIAAVSGIVNVRWGNLLIAAGLLFVAVALFVASVYWPEPYNDPFFQTLTEAGVIDDPSYVQEFLYLTRIRKSLAFHVLEEIDDFRGLAETAYPGSTEHIEDEYEVQVGIFREYGVTLNQQDKAVIRDAVEQEWNRIHDDASER